jgi:hypothetical protein
MVIGGRENMSKVSAVELFNIRTRQVCTMDAKLAQGMKGHSGTMLNNVPTICGGAVIGSVPTQTCYQYTKDSSGKMQWANNPNVSFTICFKS